MMPQTRATDVFKYIIWIEVTDGGALVGVAKRKMRSSFLSPSINYTTSSLTHKHIMDSCKMFLRWKNKIGSQYTSDCEQKRIQKYWSKKVTGN